MEKISATRYREFIFNDRFYFSRNPILHLIIPILNGYQLDSHWSTIIKN